MKILKNYTNMFRVASHARRKHHIPFELSPIRGGETNTHAITWKYEKAIAHMVRPYAVNQCQACAVGICEKTLSASKLSKQASLCGGMVQSRANPKANWLAITSQSSHRSEHKRIVGNTDLSKQPSLS